MLDYSPGTTLIHRLDIRVKMLIFFFLNIFLFLFNHPLFMGISVLLAILLFLYIRVPLRQLQGILTPIAPVLVFIVLFSGFTYAPSAFESEWAKQVLFYAWSGNHLPFSYGGIMMGLTLMFRIFAMIVITAILIITTPLDDFLIWMRSIKLPQQLTFIVVTGIRFVPTMQKKADQVLSAQKARGTKFKGNGIFGQVFAFLPVMVPLIVDSLRMSENLAISMLNRGYGASQKWTALKELQFVTMDLIILLISIILFASIIYLKIQGIGMI